VAAVALVAAVLAGGACSGGGAESRTGSGSSTSVPTDDDAAAAAPGSPTAAATVELAAARFEPAKVTVQVGETVRWHWSGGVTHDVAGGSFKSALKSKGTFEHTFTTAGSFAFHCNVHPTMKGSVTVEP
jgi:plastocyanin